MVEAQPTWNITADEMADVLARRDGERLADLLLSESLGSELLAEFESRALAA